MTLIVENVKQENKQEKTEESKLTGQKVALVTGGGQGIGRAIVQKLLLLHYSVVVADIDKEAGAETVALYQSLGNVFYFSMDVREEAGVKDVIDKVVEVFGGLDVLVNDAAIGIFKPMTELTLDEWNSVIGTNLTGPFLCAKYATPHLKASHGVIVNIASTRAFQSEPNTEAYSASKGGIVSLTHALAISLGPDVRVNCISPGWIEVSDWKKASATKPPSQSDADKRQHPAGRVGIPDDIANLVEFLVNPANSFITGANFFVDGGMTRKMIYV
ncbi:MAG: bacilysin biosynthesis oxidoreductase BacC [Promethearchaeota archaeon CR_4]|nr:MAG: bacilysin biosynthesis oxidoreductase BacC [Candidatus Lokiarchaeota archaeon CR_4]